MLKFILPALLLFLIVLFWEKINETIYKKFNIKINYLVLIIFIIILVVLLVYNIIISSTLKKNT